jgi:hypothetical protein
MRLENRRTIIEQKNESIKDVLKTATVENLLLIAALAQGTLKSLARQELRDRQCLAHPDDLSDEFMTNLCMF